MIVVTVLCTRCRLLHDIDPPVSDGTGWFVVGEGEDIVCGGCLAPHDRPQARTLIEVARAELERRRTGIGRADQ